MVLFVLALCLAGQDKSAPSDEEKIQQSVADLGNEDVDVRNKATAFLKSLPFRHIETFRLQAKTEQDAEKKTRLGTIVRHLAGKQGEALYREGKLSEALLLLAEAGGAADPAAEVERRSTGIRQALLKEFALFPDGGRRHYSPEVFREFRVQHGRWALPVLIEFLDPQGKYSLDAFQFLQHAMGQDAIPVVCARLKSAEEPRTYLYCDFLAMVGGSSDLAIKTLRTVMDDAQRTAVTRRCARNALVYLKVIESE